MKFSVVSRSWQERSFPMRSILNTGTEHFFQNFSKIPSPNNAKSYLIGSSGLNSRSLAVISSTAFQSFCIRVSNPSFRETFPVCKSNGSISAEDGICFQRPKSTPALSDLTIQRRNIFSLLQDDLFSGAAMCFRVLCGTSGREKK